jgi:hypothetical protein
VDEPSRKDRLVAEALAKALKKVSCYKRVFTSPDGKVVLEDLKSAFDQRLNVPGDSHGTHVRVGNYEVLQYIKEIMEVENNE